MPFGNGTTRVAALGASPSTDPEGQHLTSSWRLVKAPASSTSATLQPLEADITQLTADKPGRYVVELIVDDGALGSTPVQAIVGLHAPNTPPTAQGGADRSVAPGATVQLSGSATDVDGSAGLSLQWSLVSRPAGSAMVFPAASTAVRSFAPDVAGDYLFELVATDTAGATGKARIVVRASGASGALDSDHDGVPDTADLCAATPVGARVDVNGCAATQLPPLAISAFTANPVSGEAPLTVGFTSQASGGTGSYAYGWAFGDGQTSALQNPTHTYGGAGTYGVAVTATDTLGSIASAATNVVVSAPTVLATVPDVIGKTESVARAAILAAQLTVGNVMRVSSSTVPSGSVIAQSPTAGSRVGPGSAVDLTVSSGAVANGPPTAVDDAYSTRIDEPLTVPGPGVLANDEPHGTVLTATLLSPPTNGTLVFNADGSFTYTPHVLQPGEVLLDNVNLADRVPGVIVGANSFRQAVERDAARNSSSFRTLRIAWSMAASALPGSETAPIRIT